MEEKVQRLSEGMDFLEEALGYGEPLEYTETNESIISESNGSSPSPYKILGRCSGNFQPIGEFSRNKRLYSENLWPTILQNEELKSRLAHRAVFGCLGHADKLVDDRDIQEGKVSHIVTKLEVRKDKNTGKPFLYGELEILDTPAGRILEAMYKGGADLYVSSRAAGKLFPVPGQDYSLIKPEQYVVHTFDIVCRPGFLQARPMFEASPSESAQVSESEDDNHLIPKVSPATEVNNNQGSTKGEEESKKKQNGQSFDEILKQAQEELNKNESVEIAELNNKINQLTKIIEKVVDDVYEEEGIVEAKDAEGSEHEIIKSENKNSEHPYRLEHKVNGKTVSVSTNDFPADVKKEEEHIKNSYGIKEALPEFISLMADSNITEEAFEEILDMIKGDLK